MRALSFLVGVVVLVGCSAAPTTSVPSSGALVRVQSTAIATETETRLEITPGKDARLIVALGDRVAELDLTPAAPNPKQGDALVAFSPVSANETITVRVRARPWSGADVLESFVAPLGGEVASTGLTAAAPEFAKGKMVAVQIDILSASRAPQSTIHNLVIAAGEQPGASTRFEVAGVVAFGTPLRVQDWVMAGADGYTPALQQRGSLLNASSLTGEASIEALKAAAWTLWLQLEPEGA